MSEENSQNTQRSENTSMPQQQMDMNSLIRNLMESVVGVSDQMPEKPNSRFTKSTRACNRNQECEEDDCEEDDCEEDEDEEEDDDEDFFEVDDNFRWKTLGELVESHNRLTRAYLKMVSHRQ